MSQQESRVRWFTPDKPENISVGRQRISSHLRTAGFDVKTVATTSETIQEAFAEREQYEVIIGTTRAGAFAATLVGKLTGKPVIVDHVDPIRQFRETRSVVSSVPVRFAENVCFALSDCVMCVYEEERLRVERYAKEVRSTSLGVDYDRFVDPDRDAVESARNRLSSLPLQDNIAIYVGGLEPIYHITDLTDAMESLPEWSLIVLGEGSLRNAVEQTESERENIHYLGTVPHDDVPGYLYLADVGISLVDDPHTLKVLEYGAAGLSVVQLAGRSEERFEGMVEFARPEAEEIARAIEDAGHKESDSALASFAAKFNWESVASDYAEALKSVK
ncbi:glycosyltransferase [Halorubrum ezzemoulense]|uniref:glycosyltransferase n=1 Tax=Halorubrum ezzemoulense TaxID=337243 RepID=UPI00232CA528|nr:glycosyltransferase [Halorubrum ezzemoulense]MDB9301074.1 glycosyltransferase [Halorubrum ezzemoulense]